MDRKEEKALRRNQRVERKMTNLIIAEFLARTPGTYMTAGEIARRTGIGEIVSHRILHDLLFERVIFPNFHIFYCLNEAHPLISFVRAERKRPRGRKR